MRLIALLVAVATADCSLAPRVAREPEAPFQTDRLLYRVHSDASAFTVDIPVTYTNPALQPAYLDHCSGETFLDLEKQVGHHWVVAWSPIIQLCLSMPPITVPPGAQYHTVVHMVAAKPGTNAMPEFRVHSVNGVYRLVWPELMGSYDLRARPHGRTLPLEQRVSNRFVLRLQ